MNILFLSAWCPWPADNGSKLRIYHLLRGLSQRHQVDLLCFAPDPLAPAHEQHLQALCRQVGLLRATPFAARRAGRLLGALSPRPRSVVGNYNREMAARVCQSVAQRRYDVVVASQLHMAPYALQALGVPRVLEELELTGLYEQYSAEQRQRLRLRHWLTWLKARHYVATILGQFSGVSFASAGEQDLVGRAIAPSALQAVVPNGVSLAQCQDTYGSAQEDVLVYPGALSYDANFDAVRFFLTDIFPRIRRARPQTRLRVTGHAAPELVAALPQVEGVEYTGYLDDVRPAIADAWAQVVPLRKGGGTRLKVLEALALGTPVVSTHKGVEGLDLAHGSEVLVADNAAEFAAHTVRLLESPALRQDLATRGRHAAGRYDWAKSVDRLEALLNQVVAA